MRKHKNNPPLIGMLPTPIPQTIPLDYEYDELELFYDSFCTNEIMKCGGLVTPLTLSDWDNQEYLFEEMSGICLYIPFGLLRDENVRIDYETAIEVVFNLAIEYQTSLLAFAEAFYLINSVLGGDTSEDIWNEDKPSYIPQEITSVTIDTSSLIGRALKTTQIGLPPNMFERGLKRSYLAEGLRPISHLKNGNVEAFEHIDYPFLTAIRWCPLMLNGFDQHLVRSIFREFISGISQVK